MARDTRRDGEIRQVELDLPRRGTGRGEALAVSARVAPLGSRLVLLLVEDLTEARRIEAVRRDFVANVSHELKTPVGALSLLSEAVMDASEEPEAVERFAGRMQIEATRLTNLVQELIDLSRVQNDDPLEDAEPVRVDELVAEAIDRCRHQAGTKQITMAVGRRREPVRLGQPRPARRRPRQSRGERRQLLAVPHPGRHRRPAGARAGRCPGGGPRRDRHHRPGHRHLREGQASASSSASTAWTRPAPVPPGHRARSRHRQARGRLARRGGHRVELRGTGLHLHAAAAGGRTFELEVRARAPHQPGLEDLVGDDADGATESGPHSGAPARRGPRKHASAPYEPFPAREVLP